MDNSEMQFDFEVKKEILMSEELFKIFEILDDQNKVFGEFEIQEKIIESELGSDDLVDDFDEMELVVVKGQILCYSGKIYVENSCLFLLCSDVSWLIDLGVVVDVKVLW